MGEYLHEHGYTCLGVRLTGHATQPEAMVRSRWTDWAASVEDGYHLLCGMTDNIFLIGLSMGAVLSLLMSTRLEVRGVVAMSTPSRLPTGRSYPTWLLELMSLVIPFRPKTNEVPGSGWFDRAAYQSHVAYPQNPVRSAAELKKLVAEMRLALAEVTAPVLLLHSKDEKYVPSQDMEEIFAGLIHCSDKTRLYLTGSGHVLPRDASRDQVFKAALEFIQRINSQK